MTSVIIALLLGLYVGFTVGQRKSPASLLKPKKSTLDVNDMVLVEWRKTSGRSIHESYRVIVWYPDSGGHYQAYIGSGVSWMTSAGAALPTAWRLLLNAWQGLYKGNNLPINAERAREWNAIQAAKANQ